ncbi:MAG TPA: OsmC family protein, partial [Chitinophagales bacterium]|nr:OsmC family protein [Chitinophagales bacterium]
KPFMLVALSGCTGMDVAAIMRKAQKNPDEFSIRVTGDVSDHYPVEYTRVHLIYDFKGKDEYDAAAANAVRLSQEKYCGVSSMLKKIIPVTWEINYNGRQVFNNKVENVEVSES